MTQNSTPEWRPTPTNEPYEPPAYVPQTGPVQQYPDYAATPAATDDRYPAGYAEPGSDPSVGDGTGVGSGTVGSGPVDPAPVKAPDRRSRLGSLWVALIAGAVVLIFLLVFVLQNGASVSVRYFGLNGSLPLGVAMLFSAIAGALVAGLFGTVRILQIRRRAKKVAHQGR